jgi:hypothetical protein
MVLVAPAMLNGQWLASQGDAVRHASLDLHAVSSLDAAALAYFALAALEATPPRLLASPPPIAHLLSTVGLGTLLASPAVEA